MKARSFKASRSTISKGSGSTRFAPGVWTWKISVSATFAKLL